MDFSFQETGTQFTARGTVSEVQQRLEAHTQELGYLTLGVVMTMLGQGQREVAFDFTSDPGIDEAPFEVTIHHTRQGEPTHAVFRFLEEGPAHG